MLKDAIIANRSYAILDITPVQKLDKIAIEVMKQDCPEYLLPFKTISIDGAMELRYELTDGVRLSYQSQRMYKREFIQQMINMLMPFQECGDWLLDYHFILLDPQYIFVSSRDGSVHYIYLPVQEYAQSDETIMNFFSRFVVNTELLDDKTYTLQLLRILQDGHSNLLTLLEYLQTEKNRNMDTFQKPPVSEPQPIKQPQQQEAPKEGGWHGFSQGIEPSVQSTENGEEDKAKADFGKSNIENELLGSLYEEKGAGKKKEKKKKEKKEKPVKTKQAGKGFLGGLLGGKKEKVPDGQNEKESESADHVLMQENGSRSEPVRGYVPAQVSQMDRRFADSDATEVEGEFADESDPLVLRLKLENARNYTVPEIIELHLENGHATVGRYDKYGSPCADFNFDYSLTFVSRNHFRVELQGTGYKIIDLNSGNGTILNGQELMPNYAYDLHAGDVIVISRKTRLTYHVL